MVKKTRKSIVSVKNSRSDLFRLENISTISDSEEDVPDFDESSGDEELGIQAGEKNSDVKSTQSSEKRSKLSGNGFNHAFSFSLDGESDRDANFNGWDFQMNSGSHEGQSTSVDLDKIIRRKGGLSGKIVDVNVNSTGNIRGGNKQSHTSDNDISDDEDDEDDEVESNNSDKEADSDESSVGDERMSEIQSKVQTTDEQSIEDNIANLSDDEDSAEAIANFFDTPEDIRSELNGKHDTFQSLKLSRPLLKALSTLGYSSPTPIQNASIPMALLGKDIVAGAVTGSGKTAAYMIPIIERLLYKPSKVASTKVIVLTPTRELAIQVADVGKKIGQYVAGLTFGLAVGGLNLRQQEQELKKRPDVVIATPGRFIDHIRNSPSFNVDNVEVLVFDEADRMLEEGFQQEITEILSLLPRKKQTMLFSATMNSKIKSLIQLSLNKPVRIMLGAPKAAASGLVQEFVRIRKRESLKPALLFNILSTVEGHQSRVIVFVARKEMAHRLRIALGLLGLKVSELHGSLSQEQRLKSVTEFKTLAVPVLICTDLAARGLDIPKIELVINFDMPKTHEIYLHRVGRTARAGRQGLAISFVGESSQDRSIVKESIKQVEIEQSGKAIGRNVDWNAIEQIQATLKQKDAVIEDILKEEKQEKELLKAESELKRGENMLKYESEIKARPKRDWFVSEKDKSQSGESVNSAKKRLNSKKRKAQEVNENPKRLYKKTKDDRLHTQPKKLPKKHRK
ncbi:hypothetical protein OGAPHI_004654 [Ogataea philodendri]|uniref:ATP-dependent RNA helicase DRS1 n=2 Tax=Saccharomycotina TaxID=147537 RepID=A0A9P8P3R2_9ASCO|nr:uncharacterized protein OGAPHI_004654 [Ogataea philodendri]KAH3664302.1 hypothetical protein OGAPHI_004654 [Ogataea philodendri]